MYDTGLTASSLKYVKVSKQQPNRIRSQSVARLQDQLGTLQALYPPIFIRRLDYELMKRLG